MSWLEGFKEILLHYLSALGVAGLAVGTFIEATGLPFPGGLMTLGAGFLAAQGRLDIEMALAAVVAGHSLGSLAAYHVGRSLGRPLFRRYGDLVGLTPARMARARRWLNRSGVLFVLLGRLLPTVGNVTPFAAGAGGMEPWPFAVYSVVFAFLWGTLYLKLGAYFGHNWEAIRHLLQNRLPLVVAGLLAACLVWWGVKRWLEVRLNPR
ncbi:MAG: DedA family protein [Firmicutes bacterium]|nr:DedA family protein [Bacillota bacterium]